MLDVNAPALHEGYHRRWSRVGGYVDPLTDWRIELPLFGQGQAIGRLTVCGSRREQNLTDTFQSLSQILAHAEVLASEVVRHATAVSKPAGKAATATGTLTATAHSA
jgi:UDP-GlcNAc:undecaprenyl-phosphate GlcNAc-1-phosphate transferase